MGRLRQSVRAGGRTSRSVDRVCVPAVGKLRGVARVGPAYDSGETMIEVSLTTI